jgi:hypothetical protein
MSTSYYIESGRPFVCVFSYDHIFAEGLFSVSIAILLIFSLIEHYKFGKIESLLPTTIINNTSNNRFSNSFNLFNKSNKSNQSNQLNQNKISTESLLSSY